MFALACIALSAGLAKRYYNHNKSSMVFGLLSAILLPKENANGVSKAERTASKTITLPYSYNGKSYTLILPVRSKPLGWSICMATFADGERDVTSIVEEKAGIDKNFYGATLTPGQIVRGAGKLLFYTDKGTLVHTI